MLLELLQAYDTARHTGSLAGHIHDLFVRRTGYASVMTMGSHRRQSRLSPRRQSAYGTCGERSTAAEAVRPDARECRTGEGLRRPAGRSTHHRYGTRAIEASRSDETPCASHPLGRLSGRALRRVIPNDCDLHPSLATWSDSANCRSPCAPRVSPSMLPEVRKCVRGSSSTSGFLIPYRQYHGRNYLIFQRWPRKNRDRDQPPSS